MTWKIQPNFIPQSFMYLNPDTFNLWSPSHISTELWLDAADTTTITETSARVTEWRDKSGNGNNATRNVSLTATAPKLTLAALSGNSVIEFDPALNNYNLLLLDSQLSNIEHIFFVAKKNDVDYSSVVLMSNSTDIRGVNYGVNTGSVFSVQQLTPSLSTATRNVWHIAEIKTDGTTATLGIDGGRASAADGDKMIVGLIGFYQHPNNGFKNQYSFRGQIGEIILFSSALSDLDRIKMEGYLAHKWGLLANLPSDHPYKTGAPTT